MRNIALIGFMGAGKSTVAPILANLLQYKSVDVDELIKHSNHQSINEIFNSRGEEAFRKIEENELLAVLKNEQQVISCGGGIVSSENVMKKLRKNSTVVFLETSFEEISRRIKDTASRPLFRNEEEAKKLYLNRQSLYNQYADYKIITNCKTPDEISAEIAQKIKIDDEINLCVVIGHPIKHSLSPIMHNAAFRALNIEKKYKFKAADIEQNELSNYIETIRKSNVKMLAVTIPHKEKIIPFLDELDSAAAKIGAVNTVINSNGQLKGYNTDFAGAIHSLKKATTFEGKNVVILGSGGAAKAIAFSLHKENAKFSICSRNEKEQNQLVEKYHCSSINWADLQKALTADIIINATPIGRNGEDFPIFTNLLNEKPLKMDISRKIIFDINYNPNGIPLLKIAHRKGMKTIDGLEFLLQQGMLQFELYTKLKAPEAAMRDALKKEINYAG